MYRSSCKKLLIALISILANQIYAADLSGIEHLNYDLNGDIYCTGNYTASLSSDNRYAVFPAGSMLVGVDNTAYGNKQVYIKDRELDTLFVVPNSYGTKQDTLGKLNYRISDDANKIIFIRKEDPYVFHTQTNEHLYIYDRSINQTSILKEGVPLGVAMDLSGNGQDAIYANGGSLTSINIDSRETEEICVSNTGEAANKLCTNPSISYDGRYVAFISSATNLGGNEGGSSSVYLRDRLHNTTTHVNEPGTSAYNGVLSGDGTTVAYISSKTIVVYDVESKEREVIDFDLNSNEFATEYPSISNNGRYLTASNFFRVVTYDLKTKKYEYYDLSGGQPAMISPDGSIIASTANLTENEGGCGGGHYQLDTFLFNNDLFGTPLPTNLDIKTASSQRSGYFGELLEQHFIVENLSSVTSTGVQVNISSSAPVELFSVVTSNGSCDSISLTSVSCNIGEVAAGEKIFVTASVTSYSEITSSIYAEVTGVEEESDTSNNQVKVDVNFAMDIDLEIAMSTSTNLASAGDIVEFIATVSNSGPFEAWDGQAVFLLPTELTNVNLITSQGGCSIEAQKATCELGNLSVDSEVTIQLQATSMVAGTFGVTGDVTAFQNDLDQTNNQTTAEIDFIMDVNLGITINEKTALVSTGNSVEFTAIVTNSGPFEAWDSQVTFPIPTEFNDLSLTSSLGSCSFEAAKAICELGTLSVDSEAIIQLKAVVMTPGIFELKGLATSSQNELDTLNNSAASSVEVVDILLNVTTNTNFFGSDYATLSWYGADNWVSVKKNGGDTLHIGLPEMTHLSKFWYDGTTTYQVCEIPNPTVCSNVVTVD